ncbi:sigma-70 family RNA polymerase sigma factor [Salipiger mucosus]|uniref:RNA polymerase sigma factor protein (Sigma-70) n=1 Tax=Salipiger mucosus DSM 16094 TaxID=1123237 RepID=S9S1N4_9RHOB|nr:sigma-70 family RNA polymerase sigma factor [Salipiger mucosus]EPX84115.1 RNA polymerase sigma factor protein (sigma-70) [Salipiger mucosus DSM 16094]
MNEPLITVEQEKDAIRRWQESRDEDALVILLRSHARIAHSTANRYSNNPEHQRDLATEGMMGLMKAADKFDLEKGNRFATYANWWVLTFITSALPKVEAVIDISSRTFIDTKMDRVSGPDKHLAHMAVFGAINLDAPINDDEGMTAMDMLECPRMNPEESAVKTSENKYREDLLKECMGELTERERDIIIRRKLAQKPETLEEISQSLGVTRERVRQIESRGMSRLKRLLQGKNFSVSMLRQ